LALTSGAVEALKIYIAQAGAAGAPHKLTIRQAVILTEAQRAEISALLAGVWKREMVCPLMLDLKPQHGYQSRVLKDGFTAEQYAEWLTIGCADVAEVSTDANGRPNLIVRAVVDHHSISYDVLVPIRSDAFGNVHVDDVIPRGLRPKQKKTVPSAFP
jgi:hypothetical protein